MQVIIVYRSVHHHHQRHQRLRSTTTIIPFSHETVKNVGWLLSLDKQRRAGHLLGLVETHDCEDSGSDIAEDTVGLLERVAFGGVGHDEGNLVESVGGLGALLLVEHLLGVAGSVSVMFACN